MKYRRFGRTELSMPVFSCGGMRYQQAWKDLKPEEVERSNQENLEATIHRSLELGINHIETARGYGSSEMQLGQILPKLPREKMIVQTKVAPQADGKEFRRVFNQSMSYLKLDHVDLLAMHGINNQELLRETLKKGGSMEAAREIQREGRARFIGFSTHSTPDVIEAAVNTGEFDYVNLHWYYVNDFNWSAVEAAQARDVGVFIISPNDKGGKLYAPPAKLVELCGDLSPMQFNDLYCLSRPEVQTLSLGASRPTDFEEHVKALEFYDRATETISPIRERLDAAMVQTHGVEWMRGWWQGIPEYFAIPGEINVREIVRLWNYAKGLDLVDWAKMRYNLLGNGGHWFPGRNAESWRQFNLTPVLEKCPFQERIEAVLDEVHPMLFEAPKKRLSES